MLGDDLVLFRDKAGKVAVLSDWCPTAGAGCPGSDVCEKRAPRHMPYMATP